MKIEYTSAPKNKDVNFLTDKLNDEAVGFGQLSPFAFYIRDDSNKIIAGCNGYIIYGCVHTSQLWVHADYRKTGLGRKLIETVHYYGIEMDCKRATLVTMSFQKAQGFYEKLGYKIDFERIGYANGASCFFLQREL